MGGVCSKGSSSSENSDRNRDQGGNQGQATRPRPQDHHEPVSKKPPSPVDRSPEQPMVQRPVPVVQRPVPVVQKPPPSIELPHIDAPTIIHQDVTVQLNPDAPTIAKYRQPDQRNQKIVESYKKAEDGILLFQQVNC